MATFSGEPVVGAFDGWALVDLDTRALVRVNDAGARLLGIDADTLPIGLDILARPSEVSLLIDEIHPTLNAGQQWQGRLSLGDHHGQSTSPLTVVMVPQLSTHMGELPVLATMLFGADIGVTDSLLARDPLTELPTRSMLMYRLEKALARDPKDNSLVGAFFLDLDGLKLINDRYGHEVGDQMLVQTARRISSCVPDHAITARFGGDEFVIVHDSLADRGEAEKLATCIIDGLSKVHGYHSVSASIGVALIATTQHSALDVIRQADAAMYRAKAQGGSQFAVFDEAMESAQRADDELRNSVLRAVATDGFGVVAQPMFALATGNIEAVELFIRVRHDQPYLANANRLFRLAHEYGSALDAAMLDRGLTLARSWRNKLGSDAPRVHLNISAQSLASPDLADRVGEALASYRLPSTAIAFEIDAGDLAIAAERERERVTRDSLYRLGVPLVVDGFDGSNLRFDELADAQVAMVKVAAERPDLRVTAGLVRALSTMRVPVCLKGIATQSGVDHAVRIGAFAGQGNALTPVGPVQSLETAIYAGGRLGF